MDTRLRAPLPSGPFPLLFAPHPWVLWALQGGGGGGRAVACRAPWQPGRAAPPRRWAPARRQRCVELGERGHMHGHRCPSLPARLEVLETNKDSWAPTVPRRPRASARAPAPGSPFTPPPPDGFPLVTIRGGILGGERVTTEPTGLSPSAQRPAVATSWAPVPGPRSVPSTQRCCCLGQGRLLNGVEAWPRVCLTWLTVNSDSAGRLPPVPPTRGAAQPCLSTRGRGRLCHGTGCRSAARRCG